MLRKEDWKNWKSAGESKPDHSIVETDLNIEKSSEDFTRLAVTQAPVKVYQQTLVRKLTIIIIIIIITATRKNTDNMSANRTTITKKQKCEEKQLYGCFKRLISNISHKKTWEWLRKRNLKREIESLLIATQNNAIGTNHIKARKQQI